LRNESVADGIARQIRETLGPLVRFEVPRDPQPAYVAQYFTERRAGANLDPRQHAIGMTFAVAIDGEVRCGGEAHDFAWFGVEELPAPEAWGFEQDRVARAVIARVSG
jgi:hypothetical protein